MTPPFHNVNLQRPVTGRVTATHAKTLLLSPIGDKMPPNFIPGLPPIFPSR